MHFNFATALVVAAFISAVIMVLNTGDKLFPLVALVATGIEMLITFRLISLSIASFKIETILAATMLVSGAICWSRASTKSSITAGTIIPLVGAVQLLWALNVLGY